MVGDGHRGPIAARRVALERDVERLVVDARRAGFSVQDLLAAVRRQWTRLTGMAG